MKLSVLLALSITGCASPPPPASPATTDIPWSVTLATSGGITGDGVGTFSIDSAGQMTVVTPERQSCSFRATSDEVARFAALLGAATPQRWRASYAPANRCCDRIEYTLTVTRGEKRTVTEWIDASPDLARDVAAIADALQSLGRQYATRCR